MKKEVWGSGWGQSKRNASMEHGVPFCLGPLLKLGIEMFMGWRRAGDSSEKNKGRGE